jgi:hypothetical protein
VAHDYLELLPCDAAVVVRVQLVDQIGNCIVVINN